MPPSSLADIKVKMGNPKVVGHLAALGLRAAEVAEGIQLGKAATQELQTQQIGSVATNRRRTCWRVFSRSWLVTARLRLCEETSQAQRAPQLQAQEVVAGYAEAPAQASRMQKLQPENFF